MAKKQAVREYISKFESGAKVKFNPNHPLYAGQNAVVSCYTGGGNYIVVLESEERIHVGDKAIEPQCDHKFEGIWQADATLRDRCSSCGETSSASLNSLNKMLDQCIKARNGYLDQSESATDYLKATVTTLEGQINWLREQLAAEGVIVNRTDTPCLTLAEIAIDGGTQQSASLDDASLLSPSEECDLHRLELKVEKALSSAWLALKELRDRQLYRSTHKTFEEYAKDRFGYNRAHAYRLIAAAEVIENLSPGGRQNQTSDKMSPIWRQNESEAEMSPIWRQNESEAEMSPIWRQKLPLTESVCRELAKLPAEKQPIAWEKVLESTGDKIPNARCAKGIVEQLLEKPRTLASNYCSEGEIFVLQRLEGKDKRYNGYWAVAEDVEERFTVKCRVCNQTLEIRQENMRRVDMTSEQLEQQKEVIERVSRLARCNLDPIVWSMLEALNRQVFYTDVQLKFLSIAEELYGVRNYQN